MSDSENESSIESLHHDRMSVSDQEVDGSRDEDDMPSVEVDFSEGIEQTCAGQDEESLPTDSTSNEDLAQLPIAMGSGVPNNLLDSSTRNGGELDKAAVTIFAKINLLIPSFFNMTFKKINWYLACANDRIILRNLISITLQN